MSYKESFNGTKLLIFDKMVLILNTGREIMLMDKQVYNVFEQSGNFDLILGGE